MSVRQCVRVCYWQIQQNLFWIKHVWNHCNLSMCLDVKKYCYDIHVAMGWQITWIGFWDRRKQFSLSHKMMNQPRKHWNGKEIWARTDKNLGRAWLVSLGALNNIGALNEWCGLSWEEGSGSCVNGVERKCTEEDKNHKISTKKQFLIWVTSRKSTESRPDQIAPKFVQNKNKVLQQSGCSIIYLCAQLNLVLLGCSQ